MTEKELRRLRRQDLLQLLLLQSKENAQLQEELKELTERVRTMEDDRARLTGWLDEKDLTIKTLKNNSEDGRGISLEGSIGSEPVKITVNEILDAVKEALEKRLESKPESNE